MAMHCIARNDYANDANYAPVIIVGHVQFGLRTACKGTDDLDDGLSDVPRPHL